MQLRSDMFDGLILSGTGDGQGIVGKAGVRMAAMGCMLAGQEAHAVQLQKMMFGGFNKAVAHPRTEFDWLTRDEAQVDAYMADEKCGFMCTNGFYHELLQGIQLANDAKNMTTMRKDLPVYIFSGDQDPVGGMGKGVQKVYQLFLDAGLTDVTMKLYPEGRHEMLNEMCIRDRALGWLRGNACNFSSKTVHCSIGYTKRQPSRPFVTMNCSPNASRTFAGIITLPFASMVCSYSPRNI